MNDLSRTSLAALATGSLYLLGSTFALAPMSAPFLLLAPLPGLMVAARRAYVFCLLWCLISAVVLAATVGSGPAAGFVVALGIPAMAMGFGLRSWWSFERTAIAGIVCWTLAILTVSLAASGGFSVAVDSAREQMLQGLEGALAASSSMANSSALVVLSEAEKHDLVDLLVTMLPALIVLTGGFMVLLNLICVRNLTGVYDDSDLRSWSAPEPLIWALIGSGFAMFIPSEAIAIVARNAFAIVLGCYFCQGLAITSYYFERYHIPRWIQVTSYVLILLQQLLAGIVLALGIFDLWGNFRRFGAHPTDMALDPNDD